MKLVSSKQRKNTIIIAVIAAVVVVAVIVGLALLLPKLIPGNNGGNNGGNGGTLNPTVIYGITVVGSPKTEYEIGEAFNPAGLLIRVDSNNNDGTRFIEGSSSELTISGFDSSVANDALVMTVKYKEYTTTFTVKIKEPYVAPTVDHIKLSDNFKTTYTLAEWKATGPKLNTGDVYVVLVYTDGSERKVDASYAECTGINRNINEPGTTEFTIYYSTYSCVVTVTITE